MSILIDKTYEEIYKEFLECKAFEKYKDGMYDDGINKHYYNDLFYNYCCMIVY